VEYFNSTTQSVCIIIYSVEVTNPSGVKSCPQVTNNNNGTIWIQYEPVESGLHSLDVKYNGNQLEGGPLEFDVARPVTGLHVIASGSGLTHGTAGSQCRFAFNTTDMPTEGDEYLTISSVNERISY